MSSSPAAVVVIVVGPADVNPPTALPGGQSVPHEVTGLPKFASAPSLIGGPTVAGEAAHGSYEALGHSRVSVTEGTAEELEPVLRGAGDTHVDVAWPRPAVTQDELQLVVSSAQAAGVQVVRVVLSVG